jgi:G3E family GTPase
LLEPTSNHRSRSCAGRGAAADRTGGTALSLFDRDKSAHRTPVSLITGFLGSGKTTLLNALLRHADMADSAVIVNEFGEIGLDHLLIEQVSGEVAIMANGCICCTVRSDLADTIRDLLARRDSGDVPPFGRVLIETTGLADPAPIVQMLLNNPLVSHFARLDAVVTTVDAVNADRQLNEHAQAIKQVAIADRLLLTKTDLADGAALGRRLAAINPAAPVIPVAYGAVAPDLLFGAALFDPGGKTADVQRWLNEAAYRDRGKSERPEHLHAGHGHSAHRPSEHEDRRPASSGHGDHDHHVKNSDQTSHADHTHHAHGDGIDAFCLTFAAPLDWDAVSGWLALLREARGPDLLRVKGILNLRDEAGPVVIHGVHHVFHPPVRLDVWPDPDGRSRIVFITRDLPRAEIEAAAAQFGL